MIHKTVTVVYTREGHYQDASEHDIETIMRAYDDDCSKVFARTHADWVVINGGEPERDATIIEVMPEVAFKRVHGPLAGGAR